MNVSLAPVSARRVCFATMVLLAAVGCQQQSSTSENDSPAAPSPAQRLADLAEQYQQAKTYQDAGELRFLVEGAPENEFRSIPFSVAFERPNKVRIHVMDTMSVADGALLRAIAQSLPGQALVKPCPATLRMEDVHADDMLVQAMRGQLDVELPQLLLLLGDDPLTDLTRERTAKQLSDSQFLGAKCRRIELTGPAGKSVLWIDAASGLLVKYEFPLEEIRRKFPLAALWAEFRGANMNGTVDPVAFQMELPPEVKLVKRFVQPLAPEPPEPLASEVEAFTFVGLDGSAVGRESLTGKIVVMDVWATWCGWCFEGLPLLEQVYQKYKGNDQIVFLAVNKDELAVSNAKVEEAFARHNLTIPIVRDTEQLTEKVFKLEGLPTTIVLGRDGTIQDYHVGYDANLTTTLPAKLEKLLAGENLARRELDAYEAEKQAYEARLADVVLEGDDVPGGNSEMARKPGAAN